MLTDQIDKLSKEQLIEVITKLYERMDTDAKSQEERAKKLEHSEEADDEPRWSMAHAVYCALRTKCNLLNSSILQMVGGTWRAPSKVE